MKQKILTVNELRELYYSMTNTELSKQLNITKATLIKYLKKNNIRMKGKGNTQKIKIKEE